MNEQTTRRQPVLGPDGNIVSPVRISAAIGIRHFFSYIVVTDGVDLGYGNTILDLTRPITSSDDVRMVEQQIFDVVNRQGCQIVVTNIQPICPVNIETGEVIIQ